MLNLQRSMFPQLNGIVYADWTAAAIPPTYLIERHMRRLMDEPFGNPHSHHASSAKAMEYMDDARRAVLRYFNASPAEYDVIWTPNATGAILLLQHYDMHQGTLLLTADNHNSMNGLREIARVQGATSEYVPLTPEFHINGTMLRKHLQHPPSQGNRLFGYPAKSNYNGMEHSLRWVSEAQQLGWDVILDAAAYLANSRLDLSVIQPTFVPVSFYKIFGYPTGIGALLVRKDALDNKLYQQWFAGGTIRFVSVQSEFHVQATGPAGFENGTVNFQAFPAITAGLEWISTIGDRKAHAVSLANLLYDGLIQIKGRNGGHVLMHSPRDTDIVTFSVFTGGDAVDASQVVQSANAHGIHLRSGCFCNPGANEYTLGYDVEALLTAYGNCRADTEFTDAFVRRHTGGTPIGAIRASFGYANTVHDIARMLEWALAYLN